MSRWQPEKTGGLSKALPTDEPLLDRWAGGDLVALDELFRLHCSAAYRVAYRRLRREADALDAVQEGFLKAFRYLGSFRRRSSFKTWLLRIVQNTAVDLLRQRNWRRAVERRYNAWPDGQGERVLCPNPAEALELAELEQVLEKALATLPEAQSRAFALFADAGLSYLEVAEALEVPVGTVMSRIYYARQKLQVCLSQRSQQ
jgi:RNA polymerase sigma-70 factor (ECF subfamily)